MVKTVLGVNHQGLTEWFLQRITAIVMVIYTVGMLIYWACHSPIEYTEWHALFSCTWMKIATIILILSVLYHAWIGMWTILTDYVKSFVLNMLLQVLIILFLVASFLYSLLVLWGI